MYLAIIIVVIVLNIATDYSSLNAKCKHDKMSVIKYDTTKHYSCVEKRKHYLWVYWEKIATKEIKLPDYIQLCLDIMKKNTKYTFDMVLLDQNNIYSYIPDLRKDINDLPIALKTDYIRIKLLHLYGGIWVDADTIVMTDLQLIQYKLTEGVDFIGAGCTGKICKNIY